MAARNDALGRNKPDHVVTLATDYRIVLDSSGAIHFIRNNDITTAGVGTDTLGTHGEGIMKPIVGNFSSVSFNGNYSFLLLARTPMLNRPRWPARSARMERRHNLRRGRSSSDFNDNGSSTLAEPFREFFRGIHEQPRHC